MLIAGDVGITPMMSAIRYLTDRSWKGEIYFFFTCKSEDNLIFREKIEYLEKGCPNLHGRVFGDCIYLAKFYRLDDGRKFYY